MSYQLKKANEGDVITMNADNTTSFQPIPDPPPTIEKPIQKFVNNDLPLEQVIP